MDTSATLDVGTFLTVAVTGAAALGGFILALFAWLRSDIRDLRQRLHGFIDSHGPARLEPSETWTLRNLVRQVLREELAKPAPTPDSSLTSLRISPTTSSRRLQPGPSAIVNPSAPCRPYLPAPQPLDPSESHTPSSPRRACAGPRFGAGTQQQPLPPAHPATATCLHRHLPHRSRNIAFGRLGLSQSATLDGRKSSRYSRATRQTQRLQHHGSGDIQGSQVQNWPSRIEPCQSATGLITVLCRLQDLLQGAAHNVSCRQPSDRQVTCPSAVSRRRRGTGLTRSHDHPCARASSAPTRAFLWMQQCQ